MKKKLNSSVCDAVVKASRTLAENAENKEWEKFADEEWEKYLETGFFLPVSFADDAFALVQFLMFI